MRIKRIPFWGEVAQLVEQRTENPCVGGSIPFLATTLRSSFRGATGGGPPCSTEKRSEGGGCNPHMYYVYIIRSAKKSSERYIGVTHDVKQRLAQHNAGGIFAHIQVYPLDFRNRNRIL